MEKSSRLQASLMSEMNEKVLPNIRSMSPNSTPSTPTGSGPNSKESVNLLGANTNMTKLDDLINKRSSAGPTKSRKEREEEEKQILEAIGRKDYSQLNAVKATQYGILERLKELIDSGVADPNVPDEENVYLLHWAAINNRLDIAKYLLKIGAKVDPIGGELETTPLNWAARSGHVSMVVLLMQSGADPTSYDVEGFAAIHLATMFAHSNVVAYLIVKGIDPDMPDQNGVTALMHACQRVHSRDPAQLLITFNARLNLQDQKGNTPMHYCVAYNNLLVMEILMKKGASLDVKNLKVTIPLFFYLSGKFKNSYNTN